MDILRYINTLESRLKPGSVDFLGNKFKAISNRIEGELTPSKIHDTLKAVVGQKAISKSTFRSYKAATLFWLADTARSRITYDTPYDDVEDAYNRIQAMTAHSLPSRSTRERTSTKFFPEASRVAVRNAGGREITDDLQLFVDCNILFGLRPSEWFGARLASLLTFDKHGSMIRGENGAPIYEPALLVDNAKASHGRANGDVREIILLPALDDEAKTTLTTWLQRVALRSQTITSETGYLNNLYQCLRRILKSANLDSGASQTLYSTRHQAIANAKAAGLDPTSIAAMFGHGSTKTARKFYGRKGRGDASGGGLPIRPSALSLTNVAFENSGSSADANAIETISTWINNASS